MSNSAISAGGVSQFTERWAGSLGAAQRAVQHDMAAVKVIVGQARAAGMAMGRKLKGWTTTRPVSARFCTLY